VQLVVVARPRAAPGPYGEILQDMRDALDVVARRCRQGGA
jgi:hypothetical protein